MNEPKRISSDHPTASGVEALIARLREDGVQAGRREAQRLVADAERRADWIVRQAQEEAEKIRAKARTEAERLENAGKDALRVALRDVVLELESILSQRVSDAVRRLIAQPLNDEQFLQRLILEVAGRAREDAGLDTRANVAILLPRDIVGLDDLRRRPEELREGTLTHFVLTVAGEVLREGVSFGVTDDGDAGIRLRLSDQGIEVELTERRIAELLLAHLQPRFQAVLAGVIQ